MRRCVLIIFTTHFSYRLVQKQSHDYYVKRKGQVRRDWFEKTRIIEALSLLFSFASADENLEAVWQTLLFFRLARAVMCVCVCLNVLFIWT